MLSPEGAPLTDKEWEIVEPLIPHKPPLGRPYHDHRTVLGGILWVARTGSSWREMPEEYGKWETAYRRYELWLKQGLGAHPPSVGRGRIAETDDQRELTDAVGLVFSETQGIGSIKAGGLHTPAKTVDSVWSA